MRVGVWMRRERVGINKVNPATDLGPWGFRDVDRSS